MSKYFLQFTLANGSVCREPIVSHNLTWAAVSLRDVLKRYEEHHYVVTNGERSGQFHLHYHNDPNDAFTLELIEVQETEITTQIQWLDTDEDDTQPFDVSSIQEEHHATAD